MKHGVIQTARRHSSLAHRLLTSAPNAWLQAMAKHDGRPLAHGVRPRRWNGTGADGFAYAELTGGIVIRRACLGNLGNLYVLQGSLGAAAREFYEQATNALHTGGEYNNGLLESIARLHLLEDRTDAARECLNTIDAALRSKADNTLYAHRHSQLTRAVVFLHEGRVDEALEQTAVALELAERSGDRLLHSLCQLTRAEILGGQARHEEFVSLMDALVPALPTLPVELLGQYERVVACALATAGNPSGRSHFGRAARIFQGLQHRPGEIELQRAWRAASGADE